MSQIEHRRKFYERKLAAMTPPTPELPPAPAPRPLTPEQKQAVSISITAAAEQLPPISTPAISITQNSVAADAPVFNAADRPLSPLEDLAQRAQSASRSSYPS